MCCLTSDRTLLSAALAAADSGVSPRQGHLAGAVDLITRTSLIRNSRVEPPTTMPMFQLHRPTKLASLTCQVHSCQPSASGIVQRSGALRYSLRFYS